MSADFVLIYAGQGVQTDVLHTTVALTDAEAGTPFLSEADAWLAALHLNLPAEHCRVRPRPAVATAQQARTQPFKPGNAV